MQPYTYKKSKRARHIRITVRRTGEVVVTVPRLVPSFMVERFVQSKSEWIEKKVAEFAAYRAKANPDAGKYGTGSRREFVAYKDQALILAIEKVAHFAPRYGVTPMKISIRNQKSRWGSCSHHGSLSFNYRIVFLPPELQDYLVVHEICHMKEFNHSKAFWDLVGQTIGDYKVLRKRLKGIDR
jgi:predicted metal-dependent hydrolase